MKRKEGVDEELMEVMRSHRGVDEKIRTQIRTSIDYEMSVSFGDFSVRPYSFIQLKEVPY